MIEFYIHNIILYRDDIWLLSYSSLIILFHLRLIFKKQYYIRMFESSSPPTSQFRDVLKKVMMRRFQTFSIFYVDILVIDHLESVFVI